MRIGLGSVDDGRLGRRCGRWVSRQVQEVAKALGLPIGAFTVREFDRDNQVAVHINDLSIPPSKLGATFMQLEDLAA